MTRRVKAKAVVLAVLLGALIATPAMPVQAAARGPEQQVGGHDGCARFRPDGPLATRDQLVLERRAIRLTRSAPVRAEAERLRDIYRGDPQGSTPSGAATIDSAVDSITLAAAQAVVLDDPSRPRFMWTANAAHCWFGLRVPGSGYGIDNPDNVYRHVAVDDSSSYVIRGQFPEHPPTQLSFVLYGEVPGTGPVTQEGAPVLGALTSEQMHVNDDGTFTITVDPNPAGGRPNHIQTPDGARVIIVRDSLVDWANETPAELSIERLSGPDAAPADGRNLASQAAHLLSQIGPYWVEWDNTFIYPRPVNTVQPPRRRGNAIGFATAGHFDLAADQALVVTIDPLAAGYLGFQTSDPWGLARNYVDRTSSLNNTQVIPNPDGTVTYVLSPRDPGVWNWLDTSGLTSGMFAIRWQAVPADVDVDRAVRSAQVVDLADLDTVLPPGTVHVDDQQRSDQLDERRTTYERRLTGG